MKMTRLEVIALFDEVIEESSNDEGESWIIAADYAADCGLSIARYSSDTLLLFLPADALAIQRARKEEVTNWVRAQRSALEYLTDEGGYASPNAVPIGRLHDGTPIYGGHGPAVPVALQALANVLGSPTPQVVLSSPKP